jgi:hypothetical protein
MRTVRQTTPELKYAMLLMERISVRERCLDVHILSLLFMLLPCHLKRRAYSCGWERSPRWSWRREGLMRWRPRLALPASISKHASARGNSNSIRDEFPPSTGICFLCKKFDKGGWVCQRRLAVHHDGERRCSAVRKLHCKALPIACCFRSCP